jgi:hypothetical protein
MSGTSCKSGLFHVPSTELQYQAEVQLPEVPGLRSSTVRTFYVRYVVYFDHGAPNVQYGTSNRQTSLILEDDAICM